MSRLGWLVVFAGCNGKDDVSDVTTDSRVTGETGTDELVLPGTTIPPEDEEALLGAVTVQWNENGHLLPSLDKLDFVARFWLEYRSSLVNSTLREEEGIDTCSAFLVQSSGAEPPVYGDAGSLTVTLDEEVLFEGEPNDVAYDARAYYVSRPEPAFGARVGISASGNATIPAFDLPLVGVLPEETFGTFTPGQGDTVDLRGMSITWENPIGSEEMYLYLGAGLNFDCHLEDDGEWTLPEEYLPLIEQYAYNAVEPISVHLRRGAPRYIPMEDKYLGTLVSNDLSWVFGGRL